MKHLKNEQGSGMVYILWIMVVSIVIFVIVLNIGKVYAVKQQAATATQQAALAGTAVIVQATKQGISDFDASEESAKQKEDYGKSVGQLIEEEKSKNIDRGQSKEIAYINALNDLLPELMIEYPFLFTSIKIQTDGAELSFKQTVREVLEKNGANIEQSTVIFSLTERRVEVEADTTYESITDIAEQYIKSFEKEIPQKGYGPSLKFVSGL